jgi:hypothetical protein
MNGSTRIPVAPSVRVRRLVVRAVLAVLYVALAVFIFVNGREHTILLDNKTAADGSVQAFRRVKVYVDKRPPVELFARDRDMVKVLGQRHRVRIETQEGAKRLETEFTVPLADNMILVSVPRMAAGHDDFWEPFIVVYERPKSDDTPPPSIEDPVQVTPSL